MSSTLTDLVKMISAAAVLASACPSIVLQRAQLSVTHVSYSSALTIISKAPFDSAKWLTQMSVLVPRLSVVV